MAVVCDDRSVRLHDLLARHGVAPGNDIGLEMARRLARDADTSLFAVGLAGFQALLHRITGVFLSLGLALFVYWLAALAGGPDTYARALESLRAMAPTLDTSLWAVRDARPAPGRFPVVIYAPSFSSMSFRFWTVPLPNVCESPTMMAGR